MIKLKRTAVMTLTLYLLLPVALLFAVGAGPTWEKLFKQANTLSEKGQWDRAESAAKKSLTDRGERPGEKPS